MKELNYLLIPVSKSDINIECKNDLDSGDFRADFWHSDLYWVSWQAGEAESCIRNVLQVPSRDI